MIHHKAPCEGTIAFLSRADAQGIRDANKKKKALPAPKGQEMRIITCGKCGEVWVDKRSMWSDAYAD